jgi:PAS domain S-box-containing protein
MKARTSPAILQLFAAALLAVILNVLFRFLLSSLPWSPPLLKGILETLAVAACILAPGYFVFLRPFMDRGRRGRTAEEALGERQRHIEFILGATKTGLDIIDETFELRYVDPQWSRVYGPWKGRKCYQYFDTRTGPCPSCSFQDALRTKQVVVMEKTLPREGNRPVQVTSIPYQDRDGTWFVAEINADISERKNVERALQQSSEDLKKAQHHARMGSWTWHLDTDAVEWSEEMFAIFGISREGFSGSLTDIIAKAIHPDDRARVDDANRSAARDGRPHPLEHRIILPDGSVRSVWSQAGELTRDEAGRPALLHGFVQDITERKKAEEEALRSSANIRRIFDTVSEGLALNEMVFDAQGDMVDYRILEVNDAFYQIADFRGGMNVVGGLATEIYGMDGETIKSFWRGHRGVSAAVLMEFVSPLNNRKFSVSASPFADNRFVTSFRDITEQDKAEKALAGSEERFRKLFAEMIDGFALHRIVCDAEGRAVDYVTLEVNRAYESFLGVSRDAVVGRKVSEFLSPEELSRWLGIFGPVALTGASTHYEMYSPQYGKYFQGTAYSPERGMFAVTFTNVSERRKSVEALIASENQFQSVFRYSGAGMVIVSVDLMFLQVNEAFARMLGYTEEELLGKSFHEVTFPDDLSVGFDLIQELLGGKREMFHMEKRYLGKGGHVTWGLVSCTLIRESNGAPRHFVTQIVDITERKLAEEALRKSEQTYRLLVDSIPDTTIHVVDRDMRQIVVGGSTKAFPGEIAAFYQPLFLKAFGGESTSTELQHEGSIYSCQVLPIVDDQGRIFAATSIAKNITLSRHADREKLAMDQSLLQMQKLESLGILAGGIAHDFNNILLGVFGYTDMARNATKDTAVSEFLSQAMESMERAKGLTQQLLTFSKGGTPVRRITPISTLVTETCQFALHGSNVACTFEIPGNLWPCTIDKGQVGQVIQNLVINAVQSMPLGGVIEVGACNVTLGEKEHPALKAGCYVCVSFTDHGTGIPPEMLPRIFDPFFTTKAQGHGLGLAISHSIIIRHEGAITAESEMGKGSTFSLHLPAARGADLESDREEEVCHRGAGSILVMDDEAPVRKLIAKMLESSGYTVTCASNGKETLACFRESVRRGAPFTAVILDLTIPGGMGGKEVAEELRKLNAETPVFVASGYADDLILARPREFGVTASISKPFRRAELMQMLERHLGGRGGAAAPPPHARA